MQDLTAGLAALAIPGERVHTEVFGTVSSITPGIVETRRIPPHPPKGPAGTGPRVSLARSGLDVRWDPKFPSLLELAEACDVPVRWACRTGVCHTCESGLISGSVTYQSDPRSAWRWWSPRLEPPAQGNVLICCAQPTADVVLDL
jgi:ferredoxin